MDEVEGTLKDFPQFWWSDMMPKAHLLIKYWKAALSYKHNTIREDHILKERVLEIGLDIDIYQGTPVDDHRLN
eukprot:14369143-Ditylum_brightwellii.AAC.1